MGGRSGHNAPSLGGKFYVGTQTLQLAVRVITRQTWRGKFYVGTQTLQLAVRVITRQAWAANFMLARKLYSWPFGS